MVYVDEHFWHALDVRGVIFLDPAIDCDFMGTAFDFDIVGNDMLVDELTNFDW